MTTTTPQVARRILSMTRATDVKLAPAIALLARVLGGEGAALPLKSANTVEHLKVACEEDDALRVRIQSILYRYRETEVAMGAVEAELATQTVTEPAIAALKRGALFMSRIHDDASTDVLLAQLFPAPTVLQADAGHL